jgi:hypothetical protein
VTEYIFFKYLPATLKLQTCVRLTSSSINFLVVSESVSLQLNKASKFCPMPCSYRLRVWSIQMHFAVRLISHFSSCDSGFVPFFFHTLPLIVYSGTNEYCSQLNFLSLIRRNVQRLKALKKALELADRTRKKYHQSLQSSRHSGATISEDKSRDNY